MATAAAARDERLHLDDGVVCQNSIDGGYDLVPTSPSAVSNDAARQLKKSARRTSAQAFDSTKRPSGIHARRRFRVSQSAELHPRVSDDHSSRRVRRRAVPAPEPKRRCKPDAVAEGRRRKIQK
jgi:hypothetical protein